MQERNTNERGTGACSVYIYMKGACVSLTSCQGEISHKIRFSLDFSPLPHKGRDYSPTAAWLESSWIPGPWEEKDRDGKQRQAVEIDLAIGEWWRFRGKSLSRVAPGPRGGSRLWSIHFLRTQVSNRSRTGQTTKAPDNANGSEHHHTKGIQKSSVPVVRIDLVW